MRDVPRHIHGMGLRIRGLGPDQNLCVLELCWPSLEAIALLKSIAENTLSGRIITDSDKDGIAITHGMTAKTEDTSYWVSKHQQQKWKFRCACRPASPDYKLRSNTAISRYEPTVVSQTC